MWTEVGVLWCSVTRPLHKTFLCIMLFLNMERYVNFAPGGYYHIYNRGVEKRDIFKEKSHYERFMKLLYVANGSKPYIFREIEQLSPQKIERGKPLVAIGAYVLMPNHFHILIKEVVDGGISTFMSKLGTGYSLYFNKKEHRVGPLFQSNFKARHARRDEYLKYLFAYIHLNPLKLMQPLWKEEGIADSGKAKQHLDSYKYSSYPEFVGVKRDEAAILDRAEFPGYFRGTLEFRDLLDEWIRIREEELV